MKTHNMRLVTKYFNSMKNKVKQIEIRLNDEKRRLINIGDIIIFKEISENPRYLKVKVIDLIHKDTFDELLNITDKIEIFSDIDISKEELIKNIYTFYTKEEEEKYGVLGIKVEVIDNY